MPYQIQPIKKCYTQTNRGQNQKRKKETLIKKNETDQ